MSNLNPSWWGLPLWSRAQRPATLLGSQDRVSCEQQDIQEFGQGHVDLKFDERLEDRLD